jgi:hypothetical protein
VIAVFARNHRPYLESAAAVAKNEPSRLITFRSAKRWSAARDALDEQVTMDVFFSPVGSDGVVEYHAILKGLNLDPSPEDPETARSLEQALPETASEGLWNTKPQQVKTLYTISHCRKLKVPFSMVRLRKASDGQPISGKFGYSYALVHADVRGADDFESLPEEMPEAKRYLEGATRRVTVNAYERSAAARAKCTDHYGTCCVVCGFAFSAVYGQIGDGFIHVHHLRPLAEIREGYEVDPIADLRPVCPNCHTMLHRRSPPYSPEELSALLRISRS